MKMSDGKIREKLEGLYYHAMDTKEYSKSIECIRNREQKEQALHEYKCLADNYWGLYDEVISTGILESEKFNVEKLVYFIMEQAASDPQLIRDFAERFGFAVGWGRFKSRI